MRLPFDLLSQNYTKPRLFLCETDKTKMCQLETIEMTGSFKFNSYSELNFTVSRTYTNMITGETQVNPFYNKIEALRLVYLEGFGYFEIQDPEIESDGIREVKNITAYGLEYTLSQKYLENFKINTGEVDSLEVINATGDVIVPISLYNEGRQELSLLNLILEKIYGWSIGHVDASLITMGRTFDISRRSVYDFIVQEICEKFNCFAVFDTTNNTINLYAEALISKHIGDGVTTAFKLSSPYSSLGAVSIDSYKTTEYVYDASKGILTFNEAPENGAKIEITDGSQEQWTTDVYVSFDNLAQEVNVSYSADDIKTVLTVKGDNDIDIRDVNMGLPYVVDLSYYYSVDWMGQDLFDAYTKYLQNYDDGELEYQENAEKMIDLSGHIKYETNRLSLQYSIADNVTSETTGTYYVRGGTAPDYYYTEVKLPTEYNSNIEHYYMLDGSDLDETKFSNFYEALKKYFYSEDEKDVSGITELKDSFEFMETYTLTTLISELTAATTLAQKNAPINAFLDVLFEQLGLTPLKTLYKAPYEKIKEVNEEDGWNETGNDNYWNYYPVTLVLGALDKEISDREATIKVYQGQYDELAEQNAEIAKRALIYNNFTDEQLIRLSPFLREDEYTDDNFVVTDIDSTETIMQTKKELLECGRIELSKLCEPKLEFSMDMANIYALPEFEPIIDQFQLGNLINVVIRSNYIKRARLLAVDINFDDFSDFTCEFGELTNLKTPSSIHADLLASALTAGKSVASNASYWNKGSDQVTSLSLLIQQGLLDANTTIKAIDGNQGVEIASTGIHLRKIDPVTGALDPKEGWIVNNQFLYSDDNFKTSTKSVFGEYTIDGQTKWGVLCDAVWAGHVVGSTISGGNININDTFIVDEFGHVTMNASSIKGYVKEDEVIASINGSPEGIVIAPGKISLTGKKINLTSDNITIDSTNFSVTKDGKITATSGEIAGWTIKQNALTKVLTMNDTDYQMHLQSPDGDGLVNAFAVRTKATTSDTWDTQFAVNYKGKLTAKDANITGAITATSLTLGTDVKIPYSNLSNAPDLSVYITKDGTIGSAPSNGATGFKVSSAGLLQASNAIIYGSIYSSNGTIGGWEIDSNSIRYGTLGEENSMWLVRTGSSSTATIAGSGTMAGWCIGVGSTFGVGKSGKLYATGVQISGKITAESGAIAGYNIGSGGSYGNALYKRVSGNSAAYEVGLKATSGDTDLAFYVKKSTDSWSSSSNVFYINNSGKIYAQDADITGTINASSGEIGGFAISSAYLRSDKTVSGTRYQTFLQAADGSSTTTAFAVRSSTDSGSSWTYQFRVNYDGSAVMRNATITGNSTIDSACIGNLNASKITAGTFSADRIPNLSADKITSGTISTDRLSASVITTGNFSSKSLSTGNLTVSNGAKIGDWSVSSGNLYAISGSVGTSLTAYGVSTGSAGSISASWTNIAMAGQNASDERLKKDIYELDSKYDYIFDDLKPVQFRYTDEFYGSGQHFGFIAQDVIETMNNNNIIDFAGIYEDSSSGTSYYQLQKQEFIALNTWQIQKLKQRVEELEKVIEELKG